MIIILKIIGVCIFLTILFLGVFPFVYYISIQSAFECDNLQDIWQQQCAEQNQWLAWLATPGIFVWVVIIGIII